MSAMGRPTAYRPEFADQAHNYCLLGATGDELAAFFGVCPRTIDNWIATVPAFAEAVQTGKAAADARVARALYDRAVGYAHKVERTALYRGEQKHFSDTVHYPPDTQACIFWLRNRRRASWQARAEETAAASPLADDIARLEAATAAPPAATPATPTGADQNATPDEGTAP